MRLYLDTSALVKLYVEEEGSGTVVQAVRDAQLVATSIIAYLEARAAFARRYREGIISRSDHRSCVRGLDVDWPRYLRLEVPEQLIRTASRVAERFELRAYDALHLGSALMLRDRLKDEVVFACWDAGLAGAARRAGLALLQTKKLGKRP